MTQGTLKLTAGQAIDMLKERRAALDWRYRNWHDPLRGPLVRARQDVVEGDNFKTYEDERS